MNQCNICGKSFLKKRSLHSHSLSHNPINVDKIKIHNKKYWTTEKRNLHKYYSGLRYRNSIRGVKNEQQAIACKK